MTEPPQNWEDTDEYASLQRIEQSLKRWLALMQTMGTFPQLSDNTRRKPTKKGGRKK